MIVVAVAAGIFFAGALVGVLILMRVAMNGERGRYLSNEAPNRLAGAARAISGLHVCMPERDLRVLSRMNRADATPHASAAAIPGESPRHSDGAE